MLPSLSNICHRLRRSSCQIAQLSRNLFPAIYSEAMDKYDQKEIFFRRPLSVSFQLLVRITDVADISRLWA